MVAGKDLPLTESIFYILLALYRPNHGYGIIQDTSALTKGRVQLGPGTLYGALSTLQKKGWIRVSNREITPRKKTQYEMTQAGKEILAEEIARLQEVLDDASKVQKEVGKDVEVSSVFQQGQSLCMD